MRYLHSLKHCLASLINAIDKYNYLLENHHRRTAVIAYQLGQEFGFSQKQVSKLTLAASIHDIGAIHIKERDQLLFIDAENTMDHEILGAKMLEGYAPFSDIQNIIRHHHIKISQIHYGLLSFNDVPIESFLLHLADRIDILAMKYSIVDKPTNEQLNKLIYEIDKRFGTIFLKELKKPFHTLVESNDFWQRIENVSFHKLLMVSLEDQYKVVDQGDIEGLAKIFARIVDYKSQFTSNHSQSVGLLSYEIGKLIGLSEDKCFEMKIAGYLHDIGKIAIPSEILDKPARLDKNEYEIVKKHAEFSSIILSQIEELGSIVKLAANHHERRDKSGYPLGQCKECFSTEMDIIAFADIFSALSEERPYRHALEKEAVLVELKKMVPNKLDEKVYYVIESNYDVLYEKNYALTKKVNSSNYH